MAGDMEKPYKEGYLWLPPQGVISQIKKTWQKKYCQLYRASKQGIQRLEIYENEDDAPKILFRPIITLENCIKITQDSQKNQAHVFRIVTKSNDHYLLACTTEEEMTQWITALQTVAFYDSGIIFEEDNDLYCSSGDVDVFNVRLMRTDASDRNRLSPGDYVLVVASAELQLKQDKYSDPLLIWPYRFIRRYGYSAGKFTFEAGRKCKSGEGEFHIEHNNEQEIFKTMAGKMKSIKKLMEVGDGLLLCGDTQLHHALSMGARSRSPLPPAPATDLQAPPRPPPPAKPRKTSHPPNVFLQQPPSLPNYDRLQSLGSTNRLNITSGYQAPPIIAPSKPFSEPTISARLADDSHRGYGVIRKKSEDSSVSHANSLPIILKPHHV